MATRRAFRFPYSVLRHGSIVSNTRFTLPSIGNCRTVFKVLRHLIQCIVHRVNFKGATRPPPVSAAGQGARADAYHSVTNTSASQIAFRCEPRISALFKGVALPLKFVTSNHLVNFKVPQHHLRLLRGLSRKGDTFRLHQLTDHCPLRRFPAWT